MRRCGLWCGAVALLSLAISCGCAHSPRRLGWFRSSADEKEPSSTVERTKQAAARPDAEPWPLILAGGPIPFKVNEIRSPYHPRQFGPQKELIPVKVEAPNDPRGPMAPGVLNHAAEPSAATDESQKPAAAPPRQERLEPPDPPIVEALRHYLNDRPGEALNCLQEHDPRSQQFLALLLPLVAQRAKQQGEQWEPRALASTLKQLRQLQQQLCSQAQLRLENAHFCTNIDRYGSFEPIVGNAQFHAGGLVRAYVEVENFQNRPRGLNFETELAIELEIRDSKRRRVWLANRRVGPERSRTPRRDLFLSCLFHLPAELPVGGRYELRIEVRDVTGRPKGANQLPSKNVPPHRIATTSLDFTARSADWRLGKNGP